LEQICKPVPAATVMSAAWLDLQALPQKKTSYAGTSGTSDINGITKIITDLSSLNTYMAGFAT